MLAAALLFSGVHAVACHLFIHSHEWEEEGSADHDCPICLTGADQFDERPPDPTAVFTIDLDCGAVSTEKRISKTVDLLAGLPVRGPPTQEA